MHAWISHFEATEVEREREKEYAYIQVFKILNYIPGTVIDLVHLTLLPVCTHNDNVIYFGSDQDFQPSISKKRTRKPKKMYTPTAAKTDAPAPSRQGKSKLKNAAPTITKDAQCKQLNQ